MNKHTIVATLALATLALVGCSTPEPTPIEDTTTTEQQQEVSPDVQFKSTLEAAGVEDPDVRNAAVDVGQKACEMFDKEPFEDAVIHLIGMADEEGVDEELLGTIVGAAVPAYCDEYLPDLHDFMDKYDQ